MHGFTLYSQRLNIASVTDDQIANLGHLLGYEYSAGLGRIVTSLIYSTRFAGPSVKTI